MAVLSLAVLKDSPHTSEILGIFRRPEGSFQRSLSWARRQVGSSTDILSTTTSQPSTSKHPATAINMLTSHTATPTSNPRPGTDVARDASSPDKGPDIKAITFGIIGGVLGLLLLSVLVYRLLRRYRGKPQTKNMHGTFREKWHWGTYSPVHGDVVFVNQDSPSMVVDGGGEQGKESSRPWWQKFYPSGTLASNNGEKMKLEPKGRRARTLYKVKRLKPGTSFEIDSEAASSVVDLTSVVSR